MARLGPGRARTRPDAVLGDKAYSSRANRELLRGRNIKAVIAEPADQAGHRRRQGREGGRPPAFDSEIYKDRKVVERSFNDHKQWRGLATRPASHQQSPSGLPTVTKVPKVSLARVNLSARRRPPL